MPSLTPKDLALGFLWYVAFLFSTTCHEAAHALAAKIGGDETAALGGQVTLNPVPHMRREPWGMLVVPVLAYLLNHSMIGWASAPFDPLWERRHPRRSAWMALAGPAANFTLMLLAVVGMHAGAAFGWLHTDLVALDAGLHALEKIDARKCKAVELRYFGGLSMEEIAQALEVSPITVRRDLRMAEAWLHNEMLSG